jgi:hypothetical protein
LIAACPAAFLQALLCPESAPAKRAQVWPGRRNAPENNEVREADADSRPLPPAGLAGNESIACRPPGSVATRALKPRAVDFAGAPDVG